MQIFFKRLALSVSLGLVLLLFILSIWGCLTTTKQQGAVSWALSPQAEKIYYYLSLEQASRSGSIEQVKEAVLGLCKVDPSVHTYIDGAALLLFRGEKEMALDIARQGLARYPDEADLNLVLAEGYILTKQTDEAISLLTSFVKRNPAATEMAMRLAELLVKTRHYPEALEILDYVPPKPPKDKPDAISRTTPSYLYVKARALAGAGQTAAAEKTLNEAVKEDPEFLEAWAELAFLLEKKNSLAEALEIYQTMLDLDRENSAIWLRIVGINLKLRQSAKAFAFARQGPPNISFLIPAASMFLDEKQYDYAEQLFLEAARLPDVSDEVYLYLALAATERGAGIEKSVGYLNMVLPDSPLFERATLLKMQAYTDLKRWNDAQKVLEEAKKEFPEQRSFWQAEASLFFQEGKDNEAEQAFRQALKKFPDDPQLMFTFGAFLDQTGRKPEAMRLMEEIVQRHPEEPSALNYVGYTLAEKGQDLQRAYALIKKAVEIEPDNPHIIDSMAWVNYQLKDYNAAWQEILKAISYSPADATIWEHYADIALALHKIKEAKEGYAKALELGPEDAAVVRRKLENLK